MRLPAALVAALPLLGAGAKWGDWAKCGDGGVPDSTLAETTKAVLPLPRYQAYEEQWQMIDIDAESGELVVTNSPIWRQLEQLKKEVKLIVSIGIPGTGKSTLSSFLGCEMDGMDATLFPSGYKKGVNQEAWQEGREYTEGVWASKPFPYTTIDDQGKSTTEHYMILDMQSLRRAERFQNKLSVSLLNDNIYKLLALLSEVVSVFIYHTEKSALTVGDWEEIGMAFTQTRENMVRRSKYEDPGAAIDSELNLKSHNDPALILVPRLNGDQDKLIKGDKFEINHEYLELTAKQAWEAFEGDSTHAPYLTLMEENFAPIKHGDKTFPFIYNPLPDIDRKTEPFNMKGGRPYQYAQGAACAKYKLILDKWNCSETAAPERPSDPSVYRMMVNNMANIIGTQTPVRLVSWPEGEEQTGPLPLTGDRIKVVLEIGVKEMNALGPLPQAALWRKIMQDRCAGEIVEWMDFTYGESKGDHMGTSKTGILAGISDGLELLRNGHFGKIDEMNKKWTELKATWSDKTPMHKGIPAWFEDKALMKAVEKTCTKSGTTHSLLLNTSYEVLEEEWNVIHEIKKRQLVEERLREAQNEIDNLKLMNLWNEWKFYIMAGCFGGLALLVLIMRIFRQANATCRACTACCGDCGDTTQSTKVVNSKGQLVDVQAGGLTQGPAGIPFAAGVSTATLPQGPKKALTVVEGTALPGAGSPSRSASSDKDAYQRLEALGEAIKTLQKQASSDNV